MTSGILGVVSGTSSAKETPRFANEVDEMRILYGTVSHRYVLMSNEFRGKEKKKKENVK